MGAEVEVAPGAEDEEGGADLGAVGVAHGEPMR